VYGTPTILVVNKKGSVRTITGLTDAYSIEQTIDEARHG
jgi:protein-disulfide isomerase